ncbi:MAG: TerB family tellurite resistance protein [Rhodospirillaceae bacterium]|nr:TerB family tellurite resistance protein [Rhodospirillaceae bacterium]
MIDKIKAMMFKRDEPVPPEDKIPAAAAALLIESAVLDGEFDAAERETIAELLGERFALPAAEVASLIEEGEVAVADSVELYSITRTLKDGLDPEERLELMEMLWQVVYADGVVHDYEANLVRRVAGLLHVPDKEVGLARKNALQRLDIAPSPA